MTERTPVNDNAEITYDPVLELIASLGRANPAFDARVKALYAAKRAWNMEIMKGRLAHISVSDDLSALFWETYGGRRTRRWLTCPHIDMFTRKKIVWDRLRRRLARTAFGGFFLFRDRK